MATIAEIREGLRIRLDTIPDLQTSAYLLSSPTPPAACVSAGPIEYDQAFAGGLVGYELKIQVFTGYVSDIGSQKKLDEMLAPTGPRSVKAAIEGDRTLGGKVDDAWVREASEPQAFMTADRPAMLMAEVTVEVRARAA